MMYTYRYTKSRGNPDFWVHVRNLQTNLCAIFSYVNYSHQDSVVVRPDPIYETEFELTEQDVFLRIEMPVLDRLRDIPDFHQVCEQYVHPPVHKFKIIHIHP
jgi:hypothetical protein